MRRLIQILSALGLSLIFLVIAAVILALWTGRGAWLFLPLTGLLTGLAVLVGLGLRGSRGGVAAFLKGQFSPSVRLNREVHLSAAEPAAILTAEAIIDLSHPIAQVSERFLSVAVDLSQVVGGKWWNPRADHIELSSGSLKSPVFNFNRPQLDRLTSALAPLYLRIGGSESDKIFYSLDNRLDVPPGCQSVLTRIRWDDLHAFCRRNGCELVFTLNAGPSTRSAEGSWNPTNAEALMHYAADQGQKVAVWELGNELNIFFFVHGFGHQIEAQQYCQDLLLLRRLRDRLSPHSQLAGQGSAYWPVVGEPLEAFFGFAETTLKQAAGLLDLFTWHYYPQQSRRCPAGTRRAHPARLLVPSALDEAGFWAERIHRLRDRYAPGLPVWLGETGNAQCGGEPGLSDTYLAGLWWLDELGQMARLGQQVVVRQSLTGMDYGLLDEATLSPRPDYWNSLLWKRLMGTTVYPVRLQGTDKLRLYAHSTPGRSGFSLLAINLDPQKPLRLELPQVRGRMGEKFILTAPDLLGQEVWLNGHALCLGPQGEIPPLSGAELDAEETINLPPLAYGFFVFRQ